MEMGISEGECERQSKHTGGRGELGALSLSPSCTGHTENVDTVIACGSKLLAYSTWSILARLPIAYECKKKKNKAKQNIQFQSCMLRKG